MAKTKISEFSTTAGNNTDINSINIAEGCAPSGINDAIRELMRQLKEFQTGGAGDSVNSGGDFSVATNKFTVASASGNTSVAGTLGVTGTTTLTGALVANGNATLGDASGDTVTIKGTPTLEVNPTLSGGTANGVLYLNGSKVATSGSALSFDGSTLAVSNSSNNQLSLNAVSVSTGTRITFSRNGTANTYFGDAYSITGSNLDATALFTSGTNPLIFGIGSEAMRLTSTGLGVGTSSPSYKLDVYTGTTGVLQRWNTGSVSMLVEADHSGNGNWYLSPQGSQTFNVKTGGSTRLTIDSSGNLGLGVTPSAWQAALGSVIQLGTGAAIVGDSGAGRLRSVANAYFNGTNWKYIADGYATYMYQNGSTGETSWQQAASGTAGNNITFTQALTLDASGNLLLGTTSTNPNAGIAFNTPSTAPNIRMSHANGTSSGTVYMEFNYDQSGCGSITQLGTSAVLYNTSSDYRLKNITGPITTSGAYIDSLNPVEGTWKADGSTFVGLIAHEVQEASRTNVATGVKDGEQMQGMDYSSAEIIANLIAEVKSLRQRVATLEAK